MLLSAWLFIGVVAVLATGLAVSTKSIGSRLWPNSDGVAIMSGVVGFIAWGIWTYGTFQLEVARDATIYQFTNPALAFFGIMMALVPGYIALTGPVDIINSARNPDMEDL